MPINEPTNLDMSGKPKGSGHVPKALSKDEINSRIRRFRDDSRGWLDTELAPEQDVYWRYYNGNCDLKYDTNRSSFVMTELRDGSDHADG